MGEVLIELLGGAMRLLGRFMAELFVHFLFETVVRGTGYLICRAFSRNADPEGSVATGVGLVVWLAIGIGALAAMHSAGAAP